MQLQQALNTTFNASTQFKSFERLSTFLAPSIVDEAFKDAGVATVRKRRLPLEAVMWTLIGMSLFRQESVWNIATNMDIALPGKQPLVAPGAMMQARKRLGANAVEHVFKKMAKHWHHSRSFEYWHGLNLLAFDGAVLRTYDTPDHSLTLSDGGYYYLGLLNRWHVTGEERHWLIPAWKGAEYEVIKSLGRNDKVVRLITSDHARKRFDELPAFI